MRAVRYLAFPALIAVVGGIYYWLSHEWAGSVMLALFAVAMLVMGLVLIPTFGDVGPTAPVDPDWHEGDQG